MIGLACPRSISPPTHYQLLGLSPQVSNPDEIRAATDRQFRRVQPHLTGPDGSLARILRAELAQARDTLLDPERRAIYDTLSPDAEVQSEPPAQQSPVKADELAPAESPAEPRQASDWWNEPGSEVAAAPAPWWQETAPEEAGPPSSSPPPAPEPIATGKLEPKRPRRDRRRPLNGGPGPYRFPAEPVLTRPQPKSHGSSGLRLS